MGVCVGYKADDVSFVGSCNCGRNCADGLVT